MLLTLECGYAFKAYAANVYSCFTGCMTYHVCDRLYPCWLVTLVSPCIWQASCVQYFFEPRHSLSILMHIVYIGIKPYQCAVVHQTQNSTKLSPWKCGIFLPYSHHESLVRIVFCVLWRTWPKMLPKFHHKNKAKCYHIFIMEIW